ncbi:TetR/AcrR family transcriptional regulator [Hyphomicrobium sp.]|uniref:TetR/AcrR family transcriptional regulator n=1 Tax=Hyphomicrobium sp. TaxID=82 RepID=UPI002BEA868D|nr:TetR/AcrR family transcriptional regulator [Hyphomicrobium sp.]HVZ05768.1 TetR/AcrR family transcriptional regulator [Hyphomicrobium sp.]
MPVNVTKRPKRKPGQKAHLTRAKIIAKALPLLDDNPDLGMAGIARGLGVAPAAIYAHFRGRLAEIHTEVIRAILADVARPPKPNETCEAYLRDLFDAVFAAFYKHRKVALLFGRKIAANYYLNPLLVERVLYALSLAGLPENEKVVALNLVMGSLVGMITIECAYPTSLSPAKWSLSQSNTVDALPAGEYPQIKALKIKLGGAVNARSVHKPTPARAQRFADSLIAGLKAQFSIV